jgi:23S rRNA (pseudouridine1915-N3)-methyltransferase
VRVKVLWFGRPGRSPYESIIADYRRRVGRRWPAEDLPLKPAGGGRGSDPGRALAAEAASLRRHLLQGWEHVLLDERGRGVDSVELASILKDLEGRSVEGVTFVVGSDLGVDPQVRHECQLCLALSRLTLPHLIARLVLWEQLFRATHILEGGAYHRSDVQYNRT